MMPEFYREAFAYFAVAPGRGGAIASAGWVSSEAESFSPAHQIGEYLTENWS
jgi:hypothetical protein